MAKKATKKTTTKRSINKKVEPSIDKKPEFKPKSFKAVSIDAIQRFEEIRESLGKNTKDPEAFEAIIMAYKSPGNDENTESEEIRNLKEEIEHKQGLIEGLGLSERKKDIDIQSLSTQLADVKSKLEIANQENISLKDKSTGDTEIQKAKELMLTSITELGFDKWENLKESFIFNKNALNEATQEIEKLKKENKTLLQNKVTISGEEFIAKITSDNFEIARRYRSALTKAGHITGDPENYPNELLNFCIPHSLRILYGKLSNS